MFKSIAAHWRRILPLTLILLVGLYLLIGFWGVPLVVRHIVLERINRNFNGQIAVERITFNPLTLRVRLENVNMLAEHVADPLTIGSITVQLQAATLWRSGLHVTRLDVEEPSMTVAIDENGQLNLLGFLDTTEARVTSETFALPLIHVGEVRIADGRVRVLDALFDPVFEQIIEPLHLTLHDLRTVPGHKNAHHFQATTDDGETIAWEGTFDVHPLQARGRLTLSDIQLHDYFLYVGHVLPVLIEDANLWLTLDYELKLDPDDPVLRWTIPHVRLADLAMTSALLPDAIYRLKAFEAVDLSADLGTRSLQLAHATLREGQLTLTRETDGTFPFLKLLGRLGQPDPRARVRGQVDRDAQGLQESGFRSPLPPDVVAHPHSIASHARVQTNLFNDTLSHVLDNLFEPWEVRLGPVTIKDQSIRWQDEHLAQPLTLELQEIRLTIDAIESRQQLMIPLNLQATLVNDQTRQTSSVKINGHILPLDLAAEIHIHAEHLDATLVNHYWHPWVAGELAHGQLRALDGTLGANLSDLSNPSLVFEGSLTLADLLLQDDDKTEVLTLASTDLQDLKLTLTPLSLSMARWHIREPRLVAGIDPDGSLTLLRLLRDAPGGDATVGVMALPQVRIDEVIVDGGSARLHEHHHGMGDFEMRVDELKASLRPLSTQPDVPATLEASLLLNQQASVRVSGAFLPLDPLARFELQMQVEDAGLKAFEPYFARYGGYEIDRGTAFVTADYRIDAGQLQGANAIRLERTYLGRATQSPDRLQVPLKLGMDLLRNRQEQISVDIPVRGDLTDPRLSIQAVVLQAIGNVIERIVTSPFDLLAGLVPGTTAQELSHLPREPLQVDLGPEDGKRLAALAQAMQQRPLLRLVITGVASEPVDGNALLEQALIKRARQSLADARTTAEQASGITMVMQGDPDDTLAALRFLYLHEVGLDQDDQDPSMPEGQATQPVPADTDHGPEAVPASHVEVEQVVEQLSADIFEVEMIRRVVEKPDPVPPQAAPETPPQTPDESQPTADPAPGHHWPAPDVMLARLLADQQVDRDALIALARQRAQVVQNELMTNHNLPETRLLVETRVHDDQDPAADEMSAARVQFRITD